MAIKFEKIESGMTLWDVRQNTGRGRWKWNIWPVNVLSVDKERRRVLASWNTNKARWISERSVTKYRAKCPVQVYR